MKLPKAVWEGTFNFGGIELRCYVLDDGKRIINSDDMAKLFKAMEEKDLEFTPEEVDKFSRWNMGIK